jgi:putative lipoprotein (rSAM/lipoprotein system)
MKKINRDAHQSRLRFYLRLLSILGFAGVGFISACNEPYEEPVVMYGAPDNRVDFYGRVQSSDSSKNIPGIEVRMICDNGWDSSSVRTESDGSWHLYRSTWEGENMTLKFVDTDSALNVGDFKEQSQDIIVSGRDISTREREINVLLEKK